MHDIDVADVNARRAIELPADAALLAITGHAASGKTETLARRYVALLTRDSQLAMNATVVTAATSRGATALGERIEALLPPVRRVEFGSATRYFGSTLDRLAFDMLAENATQTGLAYDLERIDEYDAEEIFERAIAPLFSADWYDFLGPDIDPEIPGLRAPDRFAVAVLRLIRKLRAAHISPQEFFRSAQRGATLFYANPPNLTAPALLFATKDEHRSALAVDGSELERQRRRELDLAKIITKVYTSYVQELVEHGCLTAADAITEATRLLEEHPSIARGYRQRLRIAVVDDVHDLHAGEFRFLQTIFGQRLHGVTFAGDPDAATQTFAGARPERVFAAAATTLGLQANHCVPAQIAAVARALLAPKQAVAIPAGEHVRLHRAASQSDEAAFVADSVVALVAGGTPPARIAVVHRSLRTLGAYEAALIDRGIAIELHGDAALFYRHETLDALALLWATIDPFAHAWLLRVLQMPLVGLTDAALALLCGEPASPQALLFDLPPQEDGEGGRRWDRRRDLRLGTNVVRGDRDADLDPAVRESVTAFRRRRARWQRVAHTSGVADAAATIVRDGGMYLRQPHETVARAARRGAIVDAFLAVLDRYATRNPGDDIAAALRYCERIARSESGPIAAPRSGDAVVVAAIDNIKWRRFDRIFIVDVRAGSFPPYYVPDAFLYSPTYGMVPKDSVGEAVTARTAKFVWYMHHAKLRENYSREDRRALAVALERADEVVTISAWGRPTRGVAAPELLVELSGLQPPLLNATVPEPATLPAPTPDDPREIRAEPSAASGLAHEPAFIAAERAVEMLQCVDCAPRRTIAAAFDSTVTLLSGRPQTGDEGVAERDVAFAIRCGEVVVVGTAVALIRHADRLHVAIASPNAAQAALAIEALRERVADNAFFIETTAGLNGPHPIAIDGWLDRLRDLLSGAVEPLCAEHRILRGGSVGPPI